MVAVSIDESRLMYTWCLYLYMCTINATCHWRDGPEIVKARCNWSVIWEFDAFLEQQWIDGLDCAFDGTADKLKWSCRKKSQTYQHVAPLAWAPHSYRSNVESMARWSIALPQTEIEIIGSAAESHLPPYLFWGGKFFAVETQVPEIQRQNRCQYRRRPYCTGIFSWMNHTGWRCTCCKRANSK